MITFHSVSEQRPSEKDTYIRNFGREAFITFQVGSVIVASVSEPASLLSLRQLLLA